MNIGFLGSFRQVCRRQQNKVGSAHTMPESSRVYLSEVYAFDVRDPTILKIALFWIASALGDQDGYKRPQV